MLVKLHPLSNDHCSSGYLRHTVSLASHIRNENFGEVWACHGWLHRIIALCRAKKSRVADDLACSVSHQRKSEGLRREIPDYALDQHTRRGKQQSRGSDHWAQGGCQLENEAEGLNISRQRALEQRLTHGRLKPREASQGRRKAEQPPLFEEEA